MGYFTKDKPRHCRAIAHFFDKGGSLEGETGNSKVSQAKQHDSHVEYFGTGGSHEENKYGGIPQGIAPDGRPNLVEQGEIKLGDIIGQDNQYILSNRIMIDAEHAERFYLPPESVGMTYASAFKKIYDKLKERKGNPEVKNEIAHLANNFMRAQDATKEEQEGPGGDQKGSLADALSPETQQMMAQQQGGQGMPPQGGDPSMQGGMSPEAMAAGLDPSMMGGQGMPPEAMGMNGQPSPEEIAMMQQGMGGDPSMQGAPMMACGGKVKHKYNKGGNMKTMFGGLFEGHKFAGGGSMNTTSGAHVFGGGGVPTYRRNVPVTHGGMMSRSDKEGVRSIVDKIKKGDYDSYIASMSPEQLTKYAYAHCSNPREIPFLREELLKRAEEIKETSSSAPFEKVDQESNNEGGGSSGDNKEEYPPFDTERGKDKKTSSKSSESKPESSNKSSSSFSNSSSNEDVDKIAKDVIRGKYGYGKNRKKALGDKYEAVQKRVNEIIKAKKAKQAEKQAKEDAKAVKQKEKSPDGAIRETTIPGWVSNTDEEVLGTKPAAEEEQPLQSMRPDLGSMLSDVNPNAAQEGYPEQEIPDWVRQGYPRPKDSHYYAPPVQNEEALFDEITRRARMDNMRRAGR